MKYAIAALSFFDNELLVSVVDAVSELDALYEAIKLIMTGGIDPEYWEVIKDMTAEELKQEAFDSDAVINAVLIP